MTQGAKIGLVATIGTGIVGGGVGTAYALNKSNSPTHISIQKQIENSGRTILNVEKSEHLKIKLATYKTDIQSITTLTKKDEEGLKSWCTTVLKGNFKNENDSDYSNARKLCTVPTNKEKLLSIPKKLAEDDDWEELSKTYNSSAAGNNLIIGIEKSKAEKTNLKKWCEKILKEEIAETDNTYTAAEKWCTKE